MTGSQTTCWTVIRSAAAGSTADREAFALHYEPVIRAYLGARWRNTPLSGEVEEAAQEVFVEFFRQGGPLERADPDRAGGFRAYLFGVVRNVALRLERVRAARNARVAGEQHLSRFPADQRSLSKVFDRAWATAIVREAARRQTLAADQQGAAAQRRVRLLQLRFQEGLTIRQIADRWNTDPAQLHREYAKARREFLAALREVVGYHRPEATPGEINEECRELLNLFVGE